MSYSVKFDDGLAFLCSVGSWNLVKEWAKTPALKEFCKKGHLDSTDVLSCELLDCISEGIDDPSVLATVEALQELIGGGDEDDRITLVD